MSLRKWTLLLTVAVVLAAGSAAFAAEPAAGEKAAPAAAAAQFDLYRVIGLSIGAALAAGISMVGAGIAIGRVGSAAIGALAEKPEMMGRTIVFIGLAEGLAIFGFVISILLLLKI